MRSGHGDHFPKKKRELEKRVKNYERILQTVPIILRCTLDTSVRDTSAVTPLTQVNLGRKAPRVRVMDGGPQAMRTEGWLQDRVQLSDGRNHLSGLDR